ncbi:hypothetical protein VTH8203_01358 [Vibrio thalassae]|uniref:VWFA domain-containing protein n=1 Tax=Vibrio thalassae TaxID=1243014 RepID=A0A240EHJ7_9VIBR|nr:hypothetical protein [Vibrio thalassae]SNX47743.1 hypothetical protein VTH8203_01358 [Vibrio thalassae]
MKKRWVLLLAMAVSAAVTNASNRNDIPSCYDMANVSELKPTQVERELFVIIDKTVNLNTSLKESVHKQMNRFNRSGDKITIVTFSALAEGDYTDIVFSGAFEPSLSKKDRNAMNRNKLRNLENCLVNQKSAIKPIHGRLASAFPSEQDSYPRTELVGTLLNLSNDLVAPSNAQKKVVLVVSDMLENSETLSFYRNGSVYVTDADKALTTIEESGFQGNFDQSDIYVIGAGYIEGAKRYSSQKSVNELENFWRSIFSSSNGNLKAFGKPSLLTQIQ